MLIKSQPAILFLTATSLELFAKDLEGQEILTIAKGVIKDVQIKEEEKFKLDVTGFLAKTDVKTKKAILVFGKDVLFEAIIPFSKKDTVEKEAQAFFDNISLDKDLLAKETLANNENVYAFATNRRLYQLVAEAMSAVGWELLAVVAVSIFDVKDNTLIKKEAAEILKKNDLINAGDFLQKNPVKEKVDKVDNQGETEKSSRKSLYFLLLIIPFVLILGFVFVFGSFGLSKISFTLQKPTPTIAPTAAPSPTPTIVSKKKEDIKIQVQNGTGTAGQAKLVKDALLTLGFKTIDTGNADKTDNTDTSVAFSKAIASDTKDEIVNMLKKSFASVASKATDSGAYDVIIITGTSK